MKKLMDIFFEDEEEEVVVEAPMSSVSKKIVAEEKKAPVQKKENIQDKDLLAKRPHSKSFGIIDVEELQVKKTSNNPVRTRLVEDKPYESMPPISPIFGVLKDSEENVLKTPQMTPGPTTCLGTILSPIYGQNIKDNKEEIIEEEEEPFDYVAPVRDLEINRIIPVEDKDEEVDFKNASLEEILKHDDETYVAEQEFSLFDDIEEER